MSKKIASMLDRYTEQLLEMEAAKPPKTLAEMQAWLREEGVTVVQSTIGRFLESQRASRAQKQLLELVVTGSTHCQEIDAALAKNPAPQLETVIKVFKVLIMQLATNGAASPELLSMSNNLARTAIEFISGQTKAAFKERELTIEETKFAESKKHEQQKALEYCLAEAKGTPAEELFSQAFSALKAARSQR